MKRSRKYLIESFEEEWTCPITSMPMVEPVLTLDGHSYQRTSIMDWLKKKKTSPKTGLDLNSQNVIPNIVLRNVIHKFDKEFKYEFDKICSQNNQLCDRIEKLENRVKELNKEKTKTENEYNQIKSKYSELLGNSKKVGQSYLQAKKEMQALKAENLQLKREKALLKVDAKSIQTLKSQNKLLKQQSQKLKKDNQFYLTQNQSLIQQKIQSLNSFTIAKNQLALLKNSNEQLKTLLNKQIHQNNTLIAKTDQCQKQKLKNFQLQAKYNAVLQQLKNTTAVLHKNNHQNKGFSLTDHVKDNEIQKLKLQSNRFRIQNANLKTEVKEAVAQMDKIKNAHERLVTIHSFCVVKARENQAQKTSLRQDLAYKKPQKIVQQKPQNPDIVGIFGIRGIKQQKKVEQPSQKQQYEPSKPWKAPESNNNSKPSFLGQELKLLQKDPDQKQIPELKPSPMQRNNFSPALEQFRDLIRDPSNQRLGQNQYGNKPIKHILPFKDYLLTNPVLYDQQKCQLNHTGCKINMDEFLKHNWSELKTLNLSESELDDRGFEMLTNEAIFFTSLNNLWLWNNYVVNVPKFSLDRFKNLKFVFFCIKGRHANPLNEESNKYLSEFVKKNPSIQVAYDNKPL